MPQIINTNIASLNAQRNLNRTQGDLTTALQRLSTGLRINGAKDDAAGLAISERMNAQVRGLNQAVRNANDAISLTQTAEGALQESTNILQRMRELAVQSANGTNSSSDRASLNDEFAALVAELDRIATTTTFNDLKVLDGSFSGVFQVGANADQTIRVGVGSAKTNSLGGTLYSQTLALTSGLNGAGAKATNSFTGLAANELFVAGKAIAATSASDDTVSFADNAQSAIALAAAINDVSSDTGVEATVTAASYTTSGTVFDNDFTLDNTNFLYINGQQVTGAVSGASASARVDALVALINNQVSGVTASNASGQLKLEASDGRNISVSAYDNGAATDAADVIFGQTAQIGTASTAVTIARGGIKLHAEADFAVSDTAIENEITGESSSATASNTYVSSLDISTASGANEAIRVLDLALDDVSDLRADLGAVQNRFEFTIANLQNVSENTTAAASRIRDADFAAETARLTRAQILQQAGIAMLAQANVQPQTVLALLQ